MRTERRRPRRLDRRRLGAACSGRGGEDAAHSAAGPAALRFIMASMPRKGTKHATLSPEAIELVAARFRTLGEPVRIRILQSLHGGEKTVNEIVATVGSTQPNVSKHLRILQDAGMVGRRQDGNNVYCFIADDSVLDLCDAVCGSVSDRLAQTAKLAAELGRGVRGR